MILIAWALAAPTETACGQAFDHMQTVSEAEIETLPAAERAQAKALAATVDDQARRAKFLRVCTYGKIDVSCILRSKDTAGYVDCFGRTGRATPAIQCEAAALARVDRALKFSFGASFEVPESGSSTGTTQTSYRNE